MNISPTSFVVILTIAEGLKTAKIWLDRQLEVRLYWRSVMPKERESFFSVTPQEEGLNVQN